MGTHMNGTTLVGQYDWTTGKSVYYRLVRRDDQTTQLHILMGWIKLPSEAAMRRRAKNDGVEAMERAEA